MKIRLGSILFLLVMTLMISCSKENIDNTVIEEEEVNPEVVTCNLNVLIDNDAAGTMLIAIPSDGTAPYVYEWSTGDTTQSISISASGDYEVTVTDSEGCIATQSINMTVSNPCDNFMIAITTNASGTSLLATVTGGTPPYAYEWSTGAMGQTTDIMGNGDYEITVTDSQGCVVSDTYTVSVDPCNGFSINFDIDAAGTVLRAEASGGTAPYAYSWSTGETTEVIAVVSGNTYTVDIVDANGCIVTDSFQVP